jgi:hypothetical protein
LSLELILGTFDCNGYNGNSGTVKVTLTICTTDTPTPTS